MFGGTSDIARATVKAFASAGSLERVVLAERPSTPASPDGDLGIDPALIRRVAFDAEQPERHSETVAGMFEDGDLDVVVVAFGVLPPQSSVEDPVEAARVVSVNFTGAVSVLTAVSRMMRQQGHGVIVVLSSVAGERPRRSNYLYGASKAGLDAFATGLGDDLHGSGVSVIVVRPGFVHTKMTEGMKPAPFSVTASDVANAIVRNTGKGTRTIWVPTHLRAVMILVRYIPRTIFRRLSL
ncbi:SDR family NAD(P)-dependent oxidoreductase [Knoellia sp. GCM10027112]